MLSIDLSDIRDIAKPHVRRNRLDKETVRTEQFPGALKIGVVPEKGGLSKKAVKLTRAVDRGHTIIFTRSALFKSLHKITLVDARRAIGLGGHHVVVGKDKLITLINCLDQFLEVGGGWNNVVHMRPT